MSFKVLRRFRQDQENDAEAKDLLTLGELQKAGSDLSKPAHFRHHLYFPTREAADDAGRALAEGVGYGVEGFAPDAPDDQWLVVAETTRVPSLDNVTEMRAVMERVATVEGGDYDGWEASVER